MTNLLIVDDHEIVRSGIKRLVENNPKYDKRTYYIKKDKNIFYIFSGKVVSTYCSILTWMSRPISFKLFIEEICSNFLILFEVHITRM